MIADLRRRTLTACLISDTAYHFSCKHRSFAAYCPVSRRVAKHAGGVRKRALRAAFGRHAQHESLSDIEEFYVKRILIQYAVCAIAVALMVPLARAQSQPEGLQAAFAKDAGTLSERFTGLARVMSGKYDWKPGQGVRSVSDVFNLIVKENGMLASVLSGTPNTGAKPALPIRRNCRKL